MRLLAIQELPQSKRVKLVFDDDTVLKTQPYLLADFGLYSGMELTEEDYQALLAAAGKASAKARAVRIVAAAGVSEKELQKLRGRLFSMVFQDPMTALNPSMTIGAQIAEAVLVHEPKISRDALRARVLELMELVGIDRDDFSADFSSLRIRGKGDKERIVPMLEFVREKILHYIGLIERQNICISSEKALFLTHKGKRISRTAVYRTVQEELDRAGVQGKKSPHVLRHTFATHLLNGGADMREIQELLGHASLQATQVYTHNSIAKLREIYTKAHPREKGGE